MCELQALPLISHQCATENMGMQVPLPTGPVPGQLSTWMTKPVGSLKLVASQSTSTCKIRAGAGAYELVASQQSTSTCKGVEWDVAMGVRERKWLRPAGHFQARKDGLEGAMCSR